MLAKKLLFKVHRDQARLYALRRLESQAHEAHKKAERLLREEVIPSTKRSLNQSITHDVSIKTAKFQLLKGLWIGKFGFDKSIEELMEAYHMFSDAVGDE